MPDPFSKVKDSIDPTRSEPSGREPRSTTTMFNAHTTRLGVALATLLITAPAAMAQTQAQAHAPPVVALSPSPHPVTCSDFTYVGNGIWAPTGPVSPSYSPHGSDSLTGMVQTSGIA
jgi:hypothetical protein